jgi:Ca-activated chloride channel family protein
MRIRMGAVVAVVSAVASLFLAVLLAQSDRGRLSGTVTDASGLALPGVAVTLTGVERRSTTTNVRGEFLFANLAPGAYEIRAELAGFTAHVQKLTVRAGTMPALTLKLAVGSLNETIRVEGKAADASRQAQARRIEGGIPGGVVGGTVGGMPELAAPAALAPRDFNTEAYDSVEENGLRRVASDPLSTFSIDVDTASYANVRRFLTGGSLPPAGAVRIEELINYFRFDYPQPRNGEPFSITTELAECPWNPAHRLALIGIQGRDLNPREPAPRNLVFLLDVSGSMMSPDKLPLVRNSMRMLVDVLTPADRVAIVVYAGASGLVLPSTPGDRKDVIHRAIAGLEAGGSTNGASGIRLAYQVARQHFIRNGVNRVILATDGDFNVGVTSQDELVRLIEQERASGVFLSVLGVGTGNLKDSTMEKLADKGNGNYAYLDSLHEARKVLVREAGATLETIAKDVKIQVEFNPRVVNAYRLIGYENRVLRNEDFNDDKKDAGEIGAGHSVTALYEIIPVGVAVEGPTVDPLRYQRALEPARGTGTSELATVKVRYKAPDGDTSRLLTTVLANRPQAMTANIGFASAVAEFGLLLRESDHRGQASFESIIARTRTFRGADPEGYRAEFTKIVDLAAGLKGLRTEMVRGVR